jgi:hypothetical protein
MRIVRSSSSIVAATRSISSSQRARSPFSDRPDAQWAEVDARDAIKFAAAAIDEAEYAVLAAAEATIEADTKAAST